MVFGVCPFVTMHISLAGFLCVCATCCICGWKNVFKTPKHQKNYKNKTKWMRTGHAAKAGGQYEGLMNNWFCQRIFNWWVGIFYGLMPGTYHYGHTINHHLFNNLDGFSLLFYFFFCLFCLLSKQM